MTNVMRSYLGIMELRVMEIVSIDEFAAYLAVDLPKEAVFALSNYHYRKYVVHQSTNGQGDCVIAFDTIEDAEKAIAQEVEIILEKHPECKQGVFNNENGARTDLWEKDGNFYCSFQRYWE